MVAHTSKRPRRNRSFPLQPGGAPLSSSSSAAARSRGAAATATMVTADDDVCRRVDTLIQLVENTALAASSEAGSRRGAATATATGLGLGSGSGSGPESYSNAGSSTGTGSRIGTSWSTSPSSAWSAGPSRLADSSASLGSPIRRAMHDRTANAGGPHAARGSHAHILKDTAAKSASPTKTKQGGPAPRIGLRSTPSSESALGTAAASVPPRPHNRAFKPPLMQAPARSSPRRAAAKTGLAATPLRAPAPAPAPGPHDGTRRSDNADAGAGHRPPGRAASPSTSHVLSDATLLDDGADADADADAGNSSFDSMDVLFESGGDDIAELLKMVDGTQ
ncbi:hypothetical protein Q5752_003565 [Cryptotrichosporon argae]